MSDSSSTSAKLPDKLLWLWDAPLFIDDVQVGRFYDAVVRPDSKKGSTTINLTRQTAEKIAQKLGLEAKIGLGTLGSLLTSLVKPEFKASGEFAADRTDQSAESTTIELHEISSPERQFVQLVLHYLVAYEDRLLLVAEPAKDEWRLPDTIQRVPRALAFLDLPGLEESHHLGVPLTKIIPTAAEFENGQIELIYKKVLGKDKSEPPEYPDRASTPEELRSLRKKYWQWYDINFSATKAMVAVEEASTGKGRIRWIDYRLPLTQEGDTLHLHVCPSGKYDTGVFAYNFIKRGFKHGLRVVGTLKSEPDMNVLAIYEK